MTKDEIENIAWNKLDMPNDAPAPDLLYYYAVSKIYDNVRAETSSRAEARDVKSKIREYLDKVEFYKSMSESNTKLITELNKLTAPRADIVKMDKAQLLNIIHKFEGLICGLMKDAEQDVPDFLKQEVIS